ncbi:HD-GYP domain-containing protein [Mesobacillus subterraneus]|uniref:HD-GYP domain-containing protein n=1 Tax=Mesobacillus subterraneus TaxID=285983 RepID=UPI00203BD48A|nr:HD-GYP domain-containing protein [Mesobacillus subterraneus]MCM3665261.1 HD-GYP domain-containing protein [Mesobacillus subterraneus]MCM3684274.1 HD-GYP domain-containing protein [Mesobacillus subterraneus]
MQNKLKDPSLHHEERRAIKWFLILFYILFISFEIFYYYIHPKYVLSQEVLIFDNSRYYYHLLIVLLIPIAMTLIRKGKLYSVKYVFYLGSTFLTILFDSVTYFGSNVEYSNGNIVEVFLILFAPIFVNSAFFWTVSLGTIFKYTFLGLLLQTTAVLFPIAVIIILSLLGFIILKRYQGYVEAIKTSYDNQLSGIVKGVIATIELKDPYTKGHSERVAYYANSLAEATGRYTKDELRSFTYACLLHDIGKVNIPDSILMKPGKLSKEEYEIIKTHPEVGAEAIIKVKGLGDSIDIIKSHHERWDGKGYPEQLKGNDIPYLARIVSIADAFDAMTSSRSYRSAMPVEDAYKRIVEGQGTQFDPDLVEKFKEVFPEWVTFHVKYKWHEDLPVQNYIS